MSETTVNNTRCYSVKGTLTSVDARILKAVAQELERCACIVERAGVRYGWPLRTISECVAEIREGEQP